MVANGGVAEWWRPVVVARSTGRRTPPLGQQPAFSLYSTPFEMAGHGPIKGEAWSPAGGWFFIPKNYKSNTLVVLGGLAVAGFATALVGTKLTQRANVTTEDDVVARWNKAAGEARKNAAINEVAGSA